MLVKMTAVCPCSDSKRYRQTVFMALITASKAALSGARRGLARVFAAYMRARVSCPCVRAPACANARIRQTESAAKCSPGVCSEGRILRLQESCPVAFVRITAEMRNNIRRALLYGISFCEVRNSNAPRLCCGGNGVAEGDSEE